jgi:hypothetical protein
MGVMRHRSILLILGLAILGHAQDGGAASGIIARAPGQPPAATAASTPAP